MAITSPFVLESAAFFSTPTEFEAARFSTGNLTFGPAHRSFGSLATGCQCATMCSALLSGWRANDRRVFLGAMTGEPTGSGQ